VLRWISPLLAAAVAACGIARAEEPPAADFVEPGSEWEYRVLRAPRVAEQVGAVAIHAVRAARGDDAGDAPSVTGAASAGETETMTGIAPFGASGGSERCQCATRTGDTDVERIAVLHAGRTFRVDDPDAVEVLRLRAKFRDGLIVRINGREVVRRSIDPDADAVAFATRSHGPEWETFYVPVVSDLLRAGDNQLAVEVRPSSSQPAPYFDMQLTGGAAPRLARGPIVQRVGPTSATIVFDTDLPSAAAVDYGDTVELGNTAESAGGSLAVHHAVELTGLAAGAPIHYRVRAGAAASETYALHTAPAAGEPLRIAIYGDVRGGHATHAEIVASMLNDAPDLAVVTGDLVLRGSDEADWQRFFEVTRELLARVPYYPAVGNHDLGRTGDEKRRMNEIFALWPGPPDRPEWGHWYSFWVADIHFVMLDSNSYRHDEQLEWLEQNLADASAAGPRAIFAFTHDGPYSRGLHKGDRYAAHHYVPVLEKYGVTLTFSGHDHLYQRGRVDTFDYIVTGGGGASLYAVRCGIAGKPRCSVDDGMRFVAAKHHYIIATVYAKYVRVCPKLPDGTALEACVDYDFD
jgi:predicted MPP superfamily phosphohydrolase